jgi:hypothetical protein
MAYYSQGGFQWADLYDMPVALRRFYWDKLIDAKKKEKEEHDKVNSKRPRRR